MNTYGEFVCSNKDSLSLAILLFLLFGPAVESSTSTKEKQKQNKNQKNLNLRFRLRLGGNELYLFDELLLFVTIPIGLCDRLGGEAK